MRTPIPSTSDTHGPFRKVARIEDRPAASYEARSADGSSWTNRVPAHRLEILECGHSGRMLVSAWDDPAKKRRCEGCRRRLLIAEES